MGRPSFQQPTNPPKRPLPTASLFSSISTPPFSPEFLVGNRIRRHHKPSTTLCFPPLLSELAESSNFPNLKQPEESDAHQKARYRKSISSRIHRFHPSFSRTVKK